MPSMATGRIIPIVLLLGVVATAHFGMFELARLNGTFSLPFITNYQGRVLPGTNIPIHVPKTGVDLVDNYFAFMVSVFWVDLDPSNSRAHLQGHHFLGTLSSTWLLMLLETHRGRRGAAFYFFTYFVEIVGEMAGLGLFTPLWCIGHLAATAVPAGGSQRAAEETLLMRRGSQGALGYAFVLGHVVPTLLMAFCKRGVEGLFSQQNWIIVRLYHPVLVFAFWKLFTSFRGGAAAAANRGPSTTPLWYQAASTRKFYTFTTLFSAIHHISFLAFVFAEHWVPAYVKPEVVADLDPKLTLLPFPFWQSNIKAVSFVEGISLFLQWDELLTAAAMLIWAGSLYAEAARRSTFAAGGVNVVLQAATLGIAAGPVAAAAYLLSERDDIVYATVEPEPEREKRR